MKLFVVTCCLVFAISLSAQEEEIKAVMDRQQSCWNAGDLECFMASYLDSDELIFVGSSEPKYGWDVTLNNYKKSYPDKSAMGELIFKLLKFIPLGKNHQLVVGKWSLKRTSNNLSGHFSVIFKKIKGEWKIIADHSS